MQRGVRAVVVCSARLGKKWKISSSSSRFGEGEGRKKHLLVKIKTAEKADSTVFEFGERLIQCKKRTGAAVLFLF